MKVLGLDVGSRTVDAVWLSNGEIERYEIADTGHDPQQTCAQIVGSGDHDVVVATGYGRHMMRDNTGAEIITEIKAYALGASRLFPGTAAVLDIGGQDTKVIGLSDAGAVADFEMNDKCAAGTGKFLEVMARALGYSLEELGGAALDAAAGVPISSMCTVFAESEVTGLVHRGEDRRRIALGLHQSIAKRSLSAVKRVGLRSPLVFGGGVAKNPAMVKLISEGFAGEVIVPDEPQIVGAYGAALYGAGLATGR